MQFSPVLAVVVGLESSEIKNSVVKLITDNDSMRHRDQPRSLKLYNWLTTYNFLLVIKSMGATLPALPTTHTHTQPFYCSSGICPGPPG